MNGDGVIELGMDFGAVDVEAVGIVNYDQNTGETSMSITAKYIMKIDKGLLQDVADRINDLEGLKPMDFKSTTLEQAMLQWDDLKTADDFRSKYTIDPTSIKKTPGPSIKIHSTCPLAPCPCGSEAADKKNQSVSEQT